jgi:hypothetical protein
MVLSMCPGGQMADTGSLPNLGCQNCLLIVGGACQNECLSLALASLTEDATDLEAGAAIIAESNATNPLQSRWSMGKCLVAAQVRQPSFA